MNLESIAKQVDLGTARAFVTAARHFIDALLIEGQRVTTAATPQERDYNAAGGLSRETPPGGWISAEELRGATQRMSEAIAAEKWVEGAVFAARIFALLG